MTIKYRPAIEAVMTADERAKLGHAVGNVTIVEVVDHIDEVPTGKTFLSGAAGATPTEIATTATVAQSVSATVTPASLVGSGAIALTQTTHSGKAWHAEPGVTSLTVALADWTSGGELSVINHSGGNIPVTVGAGMTGYDNARGGRTVTGPATVVILAPLERAVIQVKDSQYCNVAITGGNPERAWAALTYYRAGEIVRATVAQGTVGIGDRIARTTAGDSRSSFDSTEAALWTELGEDPDVATTTSLTNGSVNAYFDRLRWDGATAITGTDLNALTIAGFYDGQTLTNAPNGATGWWYILHQRHSNLADVNWHHQTAYALGSGTGSTASESYVRTNVSGVWSAWVRTDNGAVPALSSTTPTMNGAAAVGTGTTAARADHVHGTDTSRAPTAAPTLTGVIQLDGSPILGDGANHGQRSFSDITGATMLVTNTTGTGASTIATTDIAARYVKPGTSGTKSNATFDVVVGSHTAGINANTQVDFRLGNGAVNTPDVTVLTLKGNGDVLAGTNLVLDASDLGSTTPVVNGTGAAGTATTVARADHVHPTDTTREATANKGAVSGYAGLDAGGRVPFAQLPTSVGTGFRLWTPADLGTTRAIDLDFESVAIGALATITNAGSLGGTADQATPGEQPVVDAVDATGRRGCLFDGTNDSLRSSAVWSLGTTYGLFAVYRRAATGAGHLISTEYPSNVAYAIGQVQDAVNNGVGGNMVFVGHFNTAWRSTAANSVLAGAIGVVAGNFDGTNINARIFGTDNLAAQTSLTGVPSGNTRIGRRWDTSGNNYFAGRMFRVVAKSGAWTTGEMQLLEGWAAHRFGTSASLPAAHPYRNSPPIVTL